MSQKLEDLLVECTDDPKRMSASQVQTFYIKGQARGYRLTSMKNFLLKLPLPDYTRKRVPEIFEDFLVDEA